MNIDIEAIIDTDTIKQSVGNTPGTYRSLLNNTGILLQSVAGAFSVRRHMKIRAADRLLVEDLLTLKENLVELGKDLADEPWGIDISHTPSFNYALELIGRMLNQHGAGMEAEAEESEPDDVETDVGQSMQCVSDNHERCFSHSCECGCHGAPDQEW